MQAPPPSILSFRSDPDFLTIEWTDGRHSRYPFIFLLDNAPGSRHENGQKLIETSSLRLDSRPASITQAGNGDLAIQWPAHNETDIYTTAWLLQLDYAVSSPEAITTWDRRLNDNLPEGDFNEIAANPEALLQWLSHIKQYGFALLRNVPPEEGRLLDVTALFGYTRETNYGKIFDVRTVVNPNNLAFTGLGISAHTDNPYRYPVPTLQLLHCLSSDTSGGDSILVDGFAIAETLRKDHPGWFSLLANTMVKFRFRDKDSWLESDTTIIGLNPDTSITAIRLNNRSVQPFSLPPDDLLEFYKAYLHFIDLAEDPAFQIRFKMEPGDLYIVDNERVMHARSAYDNTGGQRWLQGAYADRDGLLSKYRTLHAKSL